jgi:ABC-type glycerol-3-phosphate transport system permease component
MKLTESRHINSILIDILVYIILGLGSFFMLLPLLWMVSSSLKDMGSIFIFPPKWIPNPIQWYNYIAIWQEAPFLRYIENTAIITGICILGDVLSASIVAFGFARLKAPGSNMLFILVLSTMMIPYYVTIIPRYIMFKSWGWIDTFLPLTVPAFFGYPFFIFLLRQFFMTIPRELDDAARIDGCGSFGIYWKVIMPLSRTALLTVGIFSFMENWNDFMAPLIFLNSPEKYTIALGLNFFRGFHAAHWHYLMAASTVALLPCLALFFFAQRYFIQGIVTTGLKG